MGGKERGAKSFVPFVKIENTRLPRCYERVAFIGRTSRVIILDAMQEIEYPSNIDSYHLYAYELCDDICYRSRV